MRAMRVSGLVLSDKGLEPALCRRRRALAPRQVVARDPAGAKAEEEEGVDPLEEMRLFYVGARRATARLIVANAVRQ